MTVALIAALMLQGATVAAPAPATPPPARPVRGTLFIAPSGEPFRGVRGEAYPVATWFARADADHDGHLTRTEFRRDFLTYFKVLDLNGDGIIDAGEITRYEESLVPEVRVGFGSGPEFRQFSGGPGSGAPLGGDGEESDTKASRPAPDLPRGGGRYSLINSPEPVVSMDVDLNRRISGAEFAAAADRRFTLLDPDERGYLTLDTLPRTPIQARLGGTPIKRR